MSAAAQRLKEYGVNQWNITVFTVAITPVKDHVQQLQY